MKETCDVLVVAAFAPELEPLVAMLGGAAAGRIGGRSVAGRVVGVGLPAAAAGAAACLIELRPHAVVAIGTCGAYPDAGRRLGEVIVGRRSRLVDIGVASRVAQYPGPMVVALESSASMVDAIARASGATVADVATTLAITTDDATARSLGASGADAEHLEMHGVAAACAAMRVPFAAVLGVANVVGEHGREQWQAHHRSASVAAVAALVRWLREGAPAVAAAGAGGA